MPGVHMSSDPHREANEIAQARAQLHEAEDALAEVREEAGTPAAGSSRPAGAEASEAMRVRLAERRETEALAARDRGERRRGRHAWWRQAFGQRSAPRGEEEPEGRPVDPRDRDEPPARRGIPRDWRDGP